MMKLVKRVALWTVIVIMVVVIAGIIILLPVRNGAKPDYTGTYELTGLTSAVTVYTDERGMPHIYAENESDLYFATGYIMARERLWQMDLIRRATKGRLSEIFGEDYVQTDLFLRSLGMTEKSMLLLNEVSPEIREILDAFVKGVNIYISEKGKRLPPEFRVLSYKPDPWSPEDILNIIGYMGWDLASSNLSSELFNYKAAAKLGPEKAAQLIPDWAVADQFVYPGYRVPDGQMESIIALIASVEKLQTSGIPSFSGSNNWAVSGEKSETGKPLLSNDMHLGLSMPGLWIQIHQIVPGKLNVTGVAVPGEPFVVSGHNENIAWGMTNLTVDDIDLFVEIINPENPGQYKLDGQWRDIEVRDEIVRIKGGKEQKHQIRYTHRGPLVSEFRETDGAVISMKWSGFDQSNEVRAVYQLNRASSWDEFREALTGFGSISQNFVYADINGNIGLNVGGGIPVRKGTGAVPRDGSTSDSDWTGYVPFNLFPNAYNPTEGTVSSANNKTVPDDYPFYISTEFSMPYRITRIREMLAEEGLKSVGSFKQMLGDDLSAYARLLTPSLVKALNGREDLSAGEKELAEKLAQWDYRMKKDMVEPALFEFFRQDLARNIFSDELGDLYGQLPGSLRDYYILRMVKEGPDEWIDNISTQEKETMDEIMVISFKDALERLEDSYGTDSSLWTWGDIHRFYLTHPMGKVKIIDRFLGLNSASYPAGGSNHTVAPYSYGAGFVVNHGASQRHIYNTANWDESLSVLPTGNSGVPGSRFYGSQIETYLAGEFYPDYFTREAVEKGCDMKMELIPPTAVIK